MTQNDAEKTRSRIVEVCKDQQVLWSALGTHKFRGNDENSWRVIVEIPHLGVIAFEEVTDYAGVCSAIVNRRAEVQHRIAEAIRRELGK